MSPRVCAIVEATARLMPEIPRDRLEAIAREIPGTCAELEVLQLPVWRQKVEDLSQSLRGYPRDIGTAKFAAGVARIYAEALGVLRASAP